MSRRKRSTPRDNHSVAGDPYPTADDSAGPSPPKPRPKPWFLALAVLLETAWLVFLVVLALGG